MAFQAYGNGSTVTRGTARGAAEAFFKENPTKRKCNVIEGEVNGNFFTVTYGRKSDGQWPQSFKDVTKKQVQDLPD